MEKINLAELKKEIPFKWRVQSFSKYKAECSLCGLCRCQTGYGLT